MCNNTPQALYSNGVMATLAGIGIDRFGITPRQEGDDVIYTCPIAVFIGKKV
jgi:hypothetical protein